MPDNELNGSSKLLYQQLKGDIDRIVEMDRERWVAHDKFADEFRQEVRTAINNRGRGDVDMKTLMWFGGFLLTIITFVAINLNTSQVGLRREVDRVELRATDSISKTDTKLQIEIAKLDEKRQLEMDRSKARLEKLERLGLIYTEQTLGDIRVLQQQSKTTSASTSELKANEISLLNERILKLTNQLESIKLEKKIP